MENMSYEVLDCLREEYKENTDEDREVLASCLLYLYRTTTDDKMKEQIVTFMNDIDYCIVCGSKMVRYEWTEERPNGVELMSAMDCPICSDFRFDKGVHKA